MHTTQWVFSYGKNAPFHTLEAGITQTLLMLML